MLMGDWGSDSKKNKYNPLPPAWQQNAVNKNDILNFNRNQLQNQYGGDFSAWTPENSGIYNYNQSSGTTTNSRDGNGSDSGNGSSSSAANYYAAMLAQVQAAQDAAARRAEELARQKQEAAQAAYDKNMGYLNSAYANRNNLLQQNYNDALAQLQASYDGGARGVNQNADSAQQQAYINYMMSKRDLPQALVAQGLTGGMSESALAGMYNSYD